MWLRKDLKTKARKNVKKNYWLCIAVCFLLGFLCYEYSSSLTITSSYKYEENYNGNVINEVTKKTNLEFIELDSGTIGDQLVEVVSQSQSYLFKLVGFIEKLVEEHHVLAIGLLIAFILEVAYKFLFAYPFTVGTRKFFIENSHKDNVKIRTVLFPFKKGNYYDNVVITMLLKYIYLVLWTFTIIGLPIKMYEYRMIPFILADNPNLSRKEIFALSKKMMQGNKWRAFVLDLSFIGWTFLDALTFGLTGIFYSNPYHLATFTELYLKLKTKKQIEVN